MSASKPVFKKCVRCGYSFRGLPADHACPECGLRFDEECELYRAANPRQILVVWIAIFSGGWATVRHLHHVTSFAAASAWQKVGALAALAWFPFVTAGLWMVIKQHRRGYTVSVMCDGLIVRLPGYKPDLIPWPTIQEASVKDLPEGKPQIAFVVLKDKQRPMSIGGVCNVFPKRADVERFVEQVNSRVRAASGSC